jgi:Ig-like domain-containing protein/CARDB protein
MFDTLPPTRRRFVTGGLIFIAVGFLFLAVRYGRLLRTSVPAPPEREEAVVGGVLDARRFGPGEHKLTFEAKTRGGQRVAAETSFVIEGEQPGRHRVDANIDNLLLLQNGNLILLRLWSSLDIPGPHSTVSATLSTGNETRVVDKRGSGSQNILLGDLYVGDRITAYANTYDESTQTFSDIREIQLRARPEPVAGPDVSVQSVSITGSTPPRISAMVRNIGSAPAPETRTTFCRGASRCEYGEFSSPPFGIVDGGTTTPPLAPGQLSNPIVSGATTLGGSYARVVAACADGRLNVNEANEKNNCLAYPYSSPPMSPSPSPQAPVNNAACDGTTPIMVSGSNVNADGSVKKGQPFTATVKMKNTGTKPWAINPGPPDMTYRLGAQSPQDNMRWGTNRITIPSSPVNPRTSVTFSKSFTAPTTAGTYAFNWKMVEENVQWFGATCTKAIVVK